MKSFRGYLTEFAMQSTSDYVFNAGSSSSGLMIPISGPMFKRIWPDTIRTTVFHVLSAEDIYKLKKLEGGKKTISAFFTMMSRYLESGIAGGGGVVAELEADVLISARDDIMSQVDKTGRRWVEMSWFANAQSYGTGPAFGKVEKELNTLIANLVKKHLPKGKEVEQTRFFAQDAGAVFDIWGNMKRHLKGDGRKIAAVIKDYFDGVEEVIKKNKEVMGGIFYGYAKSKRMTDNAWDEQVVNNIEITKIHYLPKDEEVEDEEQQENIDAFVAKYKIPSKRWEYSSELEIYTREVTQAEVRTMSK
jgi:hypothetical protein